jgi:hypothetical protein
MLQTESVTTGNGQVEPSIDWKKQIKDNESELTEIIELDHGLLIELRSSNVISEFTSQPLAVSDICLISTAMKQILVKYS